MTTVQITSHCESLRADPTELKKLVRAICRRFELAHARISIGIVGDAEIGALNQEFLGHAGTTDCLSFDLSDETEPDRQKVFDLIVNGELAAREAAQRGHATRAELALYVTHGLLHHLGFDDGTPRQARRMHETEDGILRDLGYGWVYKGKSQATPKTKIRNPKIEIRNNLKCPKPK